MMSSVRIALEHPPEFYTNLDMVRGRVIIDLTRHEQVGAIIVKLEGESKTALSAPQPGAHDLSAPGPPGNIIQENHKILYKVAQVFPDENGPPLPQPVYLAPGHHEYPFQFKMPFNNACSDPAAMARIGGIAGSGPALFGLGGIRVMDGSRQLMYAHTTKTLPPSFTGFPRMAEIRYFLKITIQRPGLFKENWRYQVGLKFLPLEPPRPPISNQEAYARRPFTFQARKPSPAPTPPISYGYGGRRAASSASFFGRGQSPSPSPSPGIPPPPPSIEMSARLPHPPILTCNRPIPLRLIAKNLVDAPAHVHLIAMQIDLVGLTHIRTQDLVHTEVSRWIILSRQGLSIPVSTPNDRVGQETVLPGALWSDVPLPNTVMPSFVTCNLTRQYQLEIKLGLSWLPDNMGGNNPFFPGGGGRKGKGRMDPGSIPQEIHLPLHFSAVEVYSGVAPPAKLVEAMAQGRGRRPGKTQVPGQTSLSQQPAQQQRPPSSPMQMSPGGGPSSSPSYRPPLPVRPQQQQQQQPVHDPLYPPQLQPGQTVPPYDDAPPSYDEAMAEEMTGPVFPAGTARPAYSGQTNENGPSMIPEKS